VSIHNVTAGTAVTQLHVLFTWRCLRRRIYEWTRDVTWHSVAVRRSAHRPSDRHWQTMSHWQVRTRSRFNQRTTSKILQYTSIYRA